MDKKKNNYLKLSNYRTELYLSSFPMISRDNAPQTYWLPKTAVGEVDSHAFFRAVLRMPYASEVTLRIGGGVTFKAWLNGEYLSEGPARYANQNYSYETLCLRLGKGEHVVSFHACHAGVATRLLAADVVPFVALQALDSRGQVLDLEWQAMPSRAHRRTGRRLGCVLDWVEWCDTRRLPASGWQRAGFKAGKEWLEARLVFDSPVLWREEDLASIRPVERSLTLIDSGDLVNMSLVDHDPTAAFVTRELKPNGLPPQGKWYRYDLGRVRLGRLEMEVDLPAGTMIQAAYAESLTHGRVSPYLKTGGGEDSCMLDHWVCRGGLQMVTPLHPKGARFIEIHLFGADAQLDLRGVRFFERAYYSESPDGSFSCSDPLLNRIWRVGVDTLRSCSEDAITDNPHRERGQWLGDVVGPGMDILAAAYRDWRPLRRGLLQAGECASAEGMVPAIFPGTRQYLPSFAIQWVSAIPRYHRLTGDDSLVKSLFPVAERNLLCFDPDLTAEGLIMNPKYWNFVDWGYQGASSVFLESYGDVTVDVVDPALSLFYLAAARALRDWAKRIGQAERAEFWAQRVAPLESVLRGKFNQPGALGAEGYGYHAVALALRLGLLEQAVHSDAVERIKRHILDCFPNNPDAPRLAATTVETERVITPFFMHFVLPTLMENGEAAFVLEQMRVCWGWMLEQGYTTWLEVFDPRWSHCHQWSGCPTWLLSRYVLGLRPRFQRGFGCYDFKIFAGGLEWAKGSVPFPSREGGVAVEWRRENDHFNVTLLPDSSIEVDYGEGPRSLAAGVKVEFSLPSAMTEGTLSHV